MCNVRHRKLRYKGAQHGGDNRPFWRNAAHQIMFAIDLQITGQVGQPPRQPLRPPGFDQWIAPPLEDEHRRRYGASDLVTTAPATW